jgi:2-amino-4-hydroxy-6-hydroxymethyldihydropteridine diphosphokinase
VTKERVFVGMGSNVGARLARLRAAAKALGRLPGTSLAKTSPVYATSPVGPRQRDFLNAAAEVRTSLPPPALLKALKEIEVRLGRKARRKWGPREIDLDILFYGRRKVRTGSLRVPHPRLGERKFVLVPMAALAPRFRDPVTGRTLSALAGRLTAPDQRITVYRHRL